MNFCNKHQSHFEEEKECMYCIGRNRRGEWAMGDDASSVIWPHQIPELIQNSVEGKKYDSEKPDLSLLPKEFLEEVSKAFMHGEKKYGRYNYLGGMAWTRIIASILRHASAFNSGEDIDSESGITHLGHLGAATAMLLVYHKRGLGKDNREGK